MSEGVIAREIGKRRTFAIISHPDAGKTTLTEKLLLFGGAIQMAGTVKGRKAARHATSDWMRLEQQRGISVTSSVMQFPYRGRVVNLLDTPGHEDFSEDTYRTLTAVDSALMVIDCAKGVEERTIKLMEVCRLRDTPILTFINKLDREGREPLELLDEVEKVLKIRCAPVTWPIGMGRELKGVYHLLEDFVHLYQPSKDGRVNEGAIIPGLGSDEAAAALGPEVIDALREEIELVQGAADPFDHGEYLAGRQTPVFFGSAISNFGVQEMLDGFVTHAPGPRPRAADARTVAPHEPAFTGFVFKIQANMDPQHRDRMAFMRVCSGRFERGMKAFHCRLGREVGLGNATTFLARDREIVEAAYAGDIIGLPNHGTIKIGDTFTGGSKLRFTGIPSFAPELFRRVLLKTPLKAKQLAKGLLQLSEEGAIQVFKPLLGSLWVVGAVGQLQLEVMKHRLSTEYTVEADYEGVELTTARWVSPITAGRTKQEIDKLVANFKRKCEENLYTDGHDDLVYLAPNRWNLAKVEERFPEIRFEATREHT